MNQTQTASVIVTLINAELKDWENLASVICSNVESREKCHFLLMKRGMMMKGEKMWISVDGETSKDLVDICLLELDNIWLESIVETSSVASVDEVTDEMWKNVVEFKFNERKPNAINATNGLPLHHLIITPKDVSNWESDGIWENPQIVQLNQFVKSVKKLWPNRKSSEFHSIVFKHPSDSKRFYLYLSVDSLTTMALNS